MDGNTSPGQSHSLTFGVRNMVWKCLVWPGVRDVLTTWRWDKKSNNQKAAQAPGTGTGHPTTTLGERNFHARFSNNRMASSHHFLKPVHKRTSWLLVSPKENWEKKIPTKKKNKQKIHIIFSLLLPADWGFLSRCSILLWLRVHLLLIFPFQRNGYEEFRGYCSKSKQHAKPQRQFLLTLCPTSPFKTDDFPTFGWPRMK